MIAIPRAVRIASIALAAMLVASLFRAAPHLGGIIPAPWDKLAHLAFFGTIGVLLSAGLRSWSAWVPFLLTCACGATDEIYQSFLPGREAGLDDFAADVLAAALATWATCRGAATAPGRPGRPIK